jgi:hypothetical protein
LQDNIRKFENNYGEIDIQHLEGGDSNGGVPFGFGGPHGLA